MACRLAGEQGLLTGTSSGLNVVGARELARELDPGHTVVAVAVDTCVPKDIRVSRLPDLDQRQVGYVVEHKQRDVEWVLLQPMEVEGSVRLHRPRLDLIRAPVVVRGIPTGLHAARGWMQPEHRAHTLLGDDASKGAEDLVGQDL